MPLTKDIVCGMMVDPDTASHKSEHHKKTHYFCSPACKSSFEKDPDKYVKPEGSRAS